MIVAIAASSLWSVSGPDRTNWITPEASDYSVKLIMSSATGRTWIGCRSDRLRNDMAPATRSSWNVPDTPLILPGWRTDCGGIGWRCGNLRHGGRGF